MQLAKRIHAKVIWLDMHVKCQQESRPDTHWSDDQKQNVNKCLNRWGGYAENYN